LDDPEVPQEGLAGLQIVIQFLLTRSREDAVTRGEGVVRLGQWRGVVDADVYGEVRVW
jgi:hypothetical protein